MSNEWDALLSTKQLAEEFDVPATTLRNWRYYGRGPAYLHVGRVVRYRRSDVDAWLESQVVQPEPVS